MNTGMVRRIDDLGRIVIPKEIRSSLNLDNGDEIAIYVDDEKIVLQKYYALEKNRDINNKMLSSVNNFVDGLLLMSDKEKIITPGEYENDILGKEIKKIVDERQKYFSNEEEIFRLGDKAIKGYYAFWPIIQDSNANGVIILVKTSRITNEDVLFLNVLKNIIENS